MRHLRTLIVPLFPLLFPLLSGCTSPAGADVAPADLRATLSTLSARHNVCAAAVAVIRERKLVAVETASGCTPQHGVHPDSVFQAASLSKPVFAYAVLKLVEQGKLALDVPVVSYLPQGYRHRVDPLKAEPSALVTDPRLATITVRMVLNHTSGLPNWAGGPLPLDKVPGTAWRYSGEGYALLQRAVEAVTGQSLDAYMRAQVFAPLDMQHSGYVRRDDIATRLLAGTKSNGKPRSTLALTESVAAFTLHTTATDYANFLVAVLGDSALLARTMAAPVPVDRALDLHWGLGWGIAYAKADGSKESVHTYLWHWGNNPGYRAFAMASGRSGDGFVLLTNGENGLKLAEPIARTLLPGEHKVFRFPWLEDDLLNVLCNKLWICL